MLIPPVPSSALPERALVPGQKRFTTRRASFPHAAWLGQASAPCPIFLTAASRRSLVRVSVPVWGTVLSDPLPIVGTVGRHPAVYLMGRMPVPHRIAAFHRPGCPRRWSWGITRRFHRLSAARGWVAYALRTRPPLSCPRKGNPVRLACIRPAASVHPEPGSNSSLYYCFSILSSVSWAPHCLFLFPTACPDLSATTGVLCWPQAFNEHCFGFSSLRPTPLVLSGCKSTTFFFTRNTFFQIFLF